MRIHHGFENLPSFKNPVVTVGSYDGVHAGHRELLGRIVSLAANAKGESVVVTFSPHPRSVLGNRGEQLKLLNTLPEKALLLEQAGIDHLIVAPFTPDFSRISSLEFVRDYLLARIGTRTLVVGYNHHFGHNQEGNFDYLHHLRNEFGFSIYEVPPRTVDRDKVSSTVIRRLIQQGEMTKAAHLLSHPYIIAGKPAQDGRFTVDGPDKLLPPAGEYPVETLGKGPFPPVRRILRIGPDHSLMLTPSGDLTPDLQIVLGFVP